MQVVHCVDACAPRTRGRRHRGRPRWCASTRGSTSATPWNDALANTLLSDDGWIGVLDGEQYLGVLTPDGVYRSLRAEVDRG